MSTGVVIRLKNLPVSAGTIDIRRFFGGQSIPDGGVHIIGGDDGTAFILFSTDEDARQAMLLDGEKITGDKVKLMLSSHTEMRNMIEESQRRYEELRGLRPPEPPITNLTSRSSATGSNVSKTQYEPDPNELYVELKGMPVVSQDEIVEFFQNMPISAIRLVLDEKGRQTGQGYVRFKSHSSRLLALKKDRDFLGPRFVRVVPSTEKQWVMASAQVCETWRPGTSDNNANRKRGQSSTPSNEGTPKRSRALSPIRCDNCVELRGLPVTSTYKSVLDLFYHLKFVENGLYLEMDGKNCRGRAFGEFTSNEEYREALLKDGEILEGKQIRVINISRQAMHEQIKHHKRYLKMRREEDMKREREEMERKEREKRQAQERQQREKMYQEQKQKDEEEQRKRRENHLKKQREMEEWLARQHVKEEADRKRQEMERMERIREDERIRLQQVEKRRQEEEMRKRSEQEDLQRMEMLRELKRVQEAEEERIRLEEKRRQEAEEEERREYERKRQRELDEIELRIKEEEKLRIKQELLKHELENMENGSSKEVEMDLESPPKDDLLEHYPPPPSDALLPAKPTPPRYSVASNNDSDYSRYNRNSAPISMPNEPPASSPQSSYSSLPRRYSPPPIYSSANERERPPVVLPMPPMPAVPPIHLPPTALPPPPLPPVVPMLRLPGEPPLHPVDPLYPPPISVPTEVLPVVPPGLPPPPVIPNVIPPPIPMDNSQTSTGTVFVRIANAPFTVAEREIHDFFAGLRIAPNGIEYVMKNGKRSGHIFIKFASEEDAIKASQKDKFRLSGRELLVQTSSPFQMTQILRRFEGRVFEDLFQAGSAKPQRDNLNLESNILQDKLTCVRLGSVPPHVTTEDILSAFSGISIMPNGVHILTLNDGKCNGSAFVELVTPEDCIRATNLHATAKILGAPIRVMPVKQQDMDREIGDHKMKGFGRPPMNLPPPPIHPDSIRAPMPLPPVPPGPVRIPPPPFPNREPLRFPGDRPGPPRLPAPRGRSPTPPHMKNHRPLSPPRPPMPGRPRSPPRGPPPGNRPPNPPMRPRSPPQMPPRDMSRQEMAHRAEMDELNRRIEHERAMMRDLHGPFGDRPRFPPGGPRFPMDMPPRFERPPFPGERPRFQPMPRFPGDIPPYMMGDGPWRPRVPMDMPRFRVPHVPIKMSNLSFHITQEDILEFFLKFSPLQDSIRLQYNPAGKLTGDGLISFGGRDAADAALKELDQKPLLGRKIRLSLA